MIRRVEQAQKAISSHAVGRSRLAGMAQALTGVLDEAYERMDLAWGVLNEQYFDSPKHYTFRAQKAAELGICYATIRSAYDDLCRIGIIGKDERTEPTMTELVAAREAEERATKPRRRR
jgi:Asp/Glu/hydantoin racemase